MLRHLLLNSFINGLYNVIKRSKCLWFADYFKIYCATNSVDDCILLQCDIERIQVWCAANFMKLNSSKTGITTFSIKTEVNCRVIHKSVKHFKNSQQIDYATDHGNSYVDRERNCCSFFFKKKPVHNVALICRWKTVVTNMAFSKSEQSFCVLDYVKDKKMAR